ncbi:hypothetical protein [Streptomyces sp. NPDC092903]|uniref:hypothetical protein n=1 Tax=Streptomyces sp. NPDC092903 TaxID=3366017 RepID=UPI003813B5BC
MPGSPSATTAGAWTVTLDGGRRPPTGRRRDRPDGAAGTGLHSDLTVTKGVAASVGTGPGDWCTGLGQTPATT